MVECLFLHAACENNTTEKCFLWHALYFYYITFNTDSKPTLTSKKNTICFSVALNIHQGEIHTSNAGNTVFTQSNTIIYHLICVSKQYERDTESVLMKMRQRILLSYSIPFSFSQKRVRTDLIFLSSLIRPAYQRIQITHKAL